MSGNLALWAAAGTGIQVGAAIVASRYALSEMSPSVLALLRYAVGFLFLAPVAWRLGLVRFAIGDVVPLALLGIGQFGILVALLNAALLYIPSAQAALLFSTFPFMTLLLASALGRETFSIPKAVAVGLTIVGVGLTLGSDIILTGDGAALWTGAAFALASAFTGALCSVFYRPYLQRYPTVQVSAFAMLASVGFLAVIAAGEGFFTALPAYSAAGWGAVLFVGISSGIGYFLWLYALERATPTRVTVFLALSPVTAALIGALWLDEPVDGGLAAGIGFVAAGLWAMSRQQAIEPRDNS